MESKLKILKVKCLEVVGIQSLQGHQPGVVISVVGTVSLDLVGLQSWPPPDSRRISSPVEMIDVSTLDMCGNVHQQVETQVSQCFGDRVVGFVHGADVEVPGHEDGQAVAVVNHPPEFLDQLSLPTLG